MNRRQFTKKTLLSTAFISSISLSGFMSNPQRNIQKGIMWSSIRVGETIDEKFMAAKQAGFDGIEPMSHLNREEVLAARDKTGLKIPSVCGALHGRYPLSDPNPAVREQGLKALRHTLEDAKAYGADTVLFVPGRVTAEVAYDECWERSITEIMRIIPLAEKLNVYIAIENVNNNFLLSPLEAAQYIDEFKTPWVKFYFDIGNAIQHGWPEQWIRILGERIIKIHIKDRKRPRVNANLLEGDVNWPAVMKALDDIGYNDWATVEQAGGDTMEGLADFSYRLTKILNS